MSSTRYVEVIRRNGTDCRAGPLGKPCHARALGAPEIYRGRGESTIRPETVPERNRARKAKLGVALACVGPLEDDSS